MQLSRRRIHSAEQNIAIARQKLASLGLEVKGIEPIVHETRDSFIKARKAYLAEDVSRRQSRLGSITDHLIGAFVSDVTGEMHISDTATVRKITHEFVHARDYQIPKLFSLFDRLAKGRNRWSSFSFLEKVKFRVREFFTTAFLEGRATCCEFKLVDKLAEKIQTSVRRSALFLSIFSLSGILLASTYTELMSHIFMNIKNLIEVNPVSLLTATIFLLVTSLLTGFCYNVSKALLPYVVGSKFIIKVEKAIGNLPETLKLTEENPPTSLEMFFPSRYIKRMKATNEANSA